MATKYSWSNLGQQEQARASGRLAAEILASLPDLAGLSGPARVEAVLAEVLSRLSGVVGGFMFFSSSDQFGSNLDVVGPTGASPNPGPAVRIFPHRPTLASPQAVQAGDGIGTIQHFGQWNGAESIRLVGEAVDVGTSPNAARWRAMLVRVAGQALTEVLRLDGSVTANDTALLVYDVNSGTLKRVSVGAADSGGAGFRMLRIPN